MRRAMLYREDLDAAVFIGGMEGILEEPEGVRKPQGNRASCVPAGATIDKTLGDIDNKYWTHGCGSGKLEGAKQHVRCPMDSRSPVSHSYGCWCGDEQGGRCQRDY
jgi:hypothetical protein